MPGHHGVDLRTDGVVEVEHRAELQLDRGPLPPVPGQVNMHRPVTPGDLEAGELALMRLRRPDDLRPVARPDERLAHRRRHSTRRARLWTEEIDVLRLPSQDAV